MKPIFDITDSGECQMLLILWVCLVVKLQLLIFKNFAFNPVLIDFPTRNLNDE